MKSFVVESLGMPLGKIVMRLPMALLSLLKEIRVDLLIVLSCIGIFIPFLFFSQPVRVGDGSEYYALSTAWSSTHKPFMTEESWKIYDQLFDSGSITGLVDSSSLKVWWQSLMLGPTYDEPHFWFYSLCAAVISEFGDLVGVRIPIHSSFLLFHCILLASLLIVAWRNFGWKGLVAAIILTFISPIIWYFNKVHTEFFTYCLTTSAVILFLKRKYLHSALFLALTATQNISFSAISLLVLGLGILHRGKRNYSLGDAAMLIVTIGLIAIHPVYYYSRWGIVDPTFLIGSANVGENLRYFYVWTFDPDLGLLPNWPISFVLLVVSAFALRNRMTDRSTFLSWLVFVLCYVSVSLWAQSSTTNLNSGATPGLARYSLWYLALFIPSTFLLLEKAVQIKTKWYAGLYLALLLSGFAYNAHFYLPSKPEAYTQPSLVSYWLQRHFPRLYDPPPEIFAERYGGIGEMSAIPETSAIIGPDCRKILTFQSSQDDDYTVLGGKGCNIDPEKLDSVLIRYNEVRKLDSPTYYNLSKEELQSVLFVPRVMEWMSAAIGGNVSRMMMSGWSSPEIWGTWSKGKYASLMIPCPADKGVSEGPMTIELDLVPFIADKHPVVIFQINNDNEKVWHGSIEKEEIIEVMLSENSCDSNDATTLTFYIENPMSPTSLGLSGDDRKIGVGLRRIRFGVLSSN